MAFNLQDAVFQRLKKDRLPVIIYLVTGFQVRGTIRGFDAFTVLVELQDDTVQMVYKHAISCVNTGKNIEPASLFAALLKKKNDTEASCENAENAENAGIAEASLEEKDCQEE